MATLLLTLFLTTGNNPPAGAGGLPLPLLFLQMYPASPAADSSTVWTQPVFKDVPPQVFIFKPGAGPYENVAKEFDELIGFMAENKMPGQLAAVFYDDPVRVPAESLRWEVGVVTSQPPLHTDPFSQKIISGRKAASLIVEGLPGRNRAHYQSMQNFIRQRRYIFRPPAMEILLEPKKENAEPKTEILLPVQLKRREK